MIRFENISVENFTSVSFDILEGTVCKIITGSDFHKRTLLQTLFGRNKPVQGTVLLFGKDIYSISEQELLNLFIKVGMVWKDGGLISNLKVWENITLPAWYHMGKHPEEMEDKVISMFSDLGKSGTELNTYMKKLPGPFPVHEKRLIGLVRAMLTEPDLMIYDSLFDGLSPAMAKQLAKYTTLFHSGKPLRTSLYISTDELSLRDIRADLILRQSGEGFTA
jgi:phospholipid/cholesterol/gamma-HCH transport system ATP-binding protein